MNGSFPAPAPITPFSMAAPTPTRYADFAAPDPLNFAKSPDYQFRLSEGQRALEHTAAARGTYFTPNTMRGLVDYGQHTAAGEYGAAYDRALHTYDTNRDTAHQFFGDQTSQFNGDLAKYQADNAAQNSANSFSLAQNAQAMEAEQTAYDRSIYAKQDAERLAARQQTSQMAPQWVDPYAQPAAFALSPQAPQTNIQTGTRRPMTPHVARQAWA